MWMRISMQMSLATEQLEYVTNVSMFDATNTSIMDASSMDTSATTAGTPATFTIIQVFSNIVLALLWLSSACSICCDENVAHNVFTPTLSSLVGALGICLIRVLLRIKRFAFQCN
jgi:hypothetical protein